MSRMAVQKVKSNAVLPTRAHGAAMGHAIHSLYQCSAASKKQTEVATGLRLDKTEGRVSLLLGAVPSEGNSFIEIQQAFVETGKELAATLVNHSGEDYEVDAYSTLTKMVLLRCDGGNPNVVESLDLTDRGEGGYGSTGLK
ncbi:dUTP pyrophosphatase [Pancytospora philotis]|nr:dUTP pyrophosphatase [Pancytospora philotis]